MHNTFVKEKIILIYNGAVVNRKSAKDKLHIFGMNKFLKW